VIRSKRKQTSAFYFRNFILLSIALIAFSCSKKTLIEQTVDPGTDTIPVPASFKNGIFIVNEGNYNWGNASVSFIDAKDYIVDADAFKQVNKRSLGDVAESMKILTIKALLL